MTHRLRIAAALFTALGSAPAMPADDPGHEAAWRVAVQSRLGDAEYQVTPVAATADLAASWQAPNREQGFRTYFGADGIRVLPRVTPAEGHDGWRLDLGFTGWGRGRTTHEAAPALPAVDGNRVDYDRGTLVEWYVNARRGLKQSFRIAAAPGIDADAASDGSNPVWIELALEGGLLPVLSADRRSIDFLTGSGERVLRYAGLRVEDATGREISSSMELFCGSGDGRGGGLRILYQDAGAAYPVTVDPVLSNPAWSADGDQVAARLGVSVATAGDVNGDGFLDVLVAADEYDGGLTDEGKVFLHAGSPSGPSAVPAWSAEGDLPNARFGASVSTAGDVNGDGYSDVIVGAPFYNHGQVDEGRAFVYHGSAAGLSTAAWSIEGDEVGARLGGAVAVAGDVDGDGYSDVVLGVPFHDAGTGDEGRVVAYRGSATGLQSAPARTVDGDQAGAQLGSSVATAGDVDGDGYSDVVIGVPFHDAGTGDEGRVLVYRGSATGLESAPAWTVDGDQVGARLGSSVATAGDVDGDGYSDVVVGAPLHDDQETDEGRILVHHGSASGLAPAAGWSVEGGQAGAQFGHSVASAGDVDGDGHADVIVGAPFHDNGQVDEGRAFVYRGSASGLAISAGWSVESNQAGARLGHSVATAGDVDGDGHSDVIVGAPFYENGEAGEGRALVYRGAGGVPAADWSSTALGPQLRFPRTAGDVNGDGYADLLAAGIYEAERPVFLYEGATSWPFVLTPAWTANHGFVAAAGDVDGDGYDDVVGSAHALGQASLYHGTAAGLAPSPSWIVPCEFCFAQAAGDVNGDGYADVLLPEAFYDGALVDEGRVRVYHGSAAGLTSVPAWVLEGDQAGARLGTSAATAGDIDGDGYSDVIVAAQGAPQYRLYRGSASGLAAAPAWTKSAASNVTDSRVAAAGDVTGDGFDDVLVSVSTAEFVGPPIHGWIFNQIAWLYPGSVSGLASFIGLSVSGGYSQPVPPPGLSTAGDVNGDGHADIVVSGIGTASQSRVFLGSAAGPVLAWTKPGPDGGTAGDVNGDGYSDVVVNGSNQVMVYLGNGGAGTSLRPQQSRVSDGGAIAHLGASDAADEVGLALLGRSPFGRGRVKLEWEVEPLGASFDGSGTLSGDWADTGVSGAPLSEVASGLAPATPHRWRARLRYEPSGSPFQHFGPWLREPWNGWQATGFRTPALPLAAGSTNVLTLAKAAAGAVTLSWGRSCLASDTEYAVYAGSLGDFGSHLPVLCDTAGGTTATFAPDPADAYYLVVPRNTTNEGSYGTDSDGGQRAPGAAACRPQDVGACGSRASPSRASRRF